MYNSLKSQVIRSGSRVIAKGVSTLPSSSQVSTLSLTSQNNSRSICSTSVSRSVNTPVSGDPIPPPKQVEVPQIFDIPHIKKVRREQIVKEGKFNYEPGSYNLTPEEFHNQIGFKSTFPLDDILFAKFIRSPEYKEMIRQASYSTTSMNRFLSEMTNQINLLVDNIDTVVAKNPYESCDAVRMDSLKASKKISETNSIFHFPDVYSDILYETARPIPRVISLASPTKASTEAGKFMVAPIVYMTVAAHDAMTVHKKRHPGVINFAPYNQFVNLCFDALIDSKSHLTPELVHALILQTTKNIQDYDEDFIARAMLLFSCTGSVNITMSFVDAILGLESGISKQLINLFRHRSDLFMPTPVLLQAAFTSISNLSVPDYIFAIWQAMVVKSIPLDKHMLFRMTSAFMNSGDISNISSLLNAGIGDNVILDAKQFNTLLSRLNHNSKALFKNIADKVPPKLVDFVKSQPAEPVPPNAIKRPTCSITVSMKSDEFTYNADATQIHTLVTITKFMQGMLKYAESNNIRIDAISQANILTFYSKAGMYSEAFSFVAHLIRSSVNTNDPVDRSIIQSLSDTSLKSSSDPDNISNTLMHAIIDPFNELTTYISDRHFPNRRKFTKFFSTPKSLANVKESDKALFDLEAKLSEIMALPVSSIDKRNAMIICLLKDTTLGPPGKSNMKRLLVDDVFKRTAVPLLYSPAYSLARRLHRTLGKYAPTSMIKSMGIEEELDSVEQLVDLFAKKNVVTPEECLSAAHELPLSSSHLFDYSNVMFDTPDNVVLVAACKNAPPAFHMEIVALLEASLLFTRLKSYLVPLSYKDNQPQFMYDSVSNTTTPLHDPVLLNYLHRYCKKYNVTLPFNEDGSIDLTPSVGMLNGIMNISATELLSPVLGSVMQRVDDITHHHLISKLSNVMGIDNDSRLDSIPVVNNPDTDILSTIFAHLQPHKRFPVTPLCYNVWIYRTCKHHILELNDGSSADKTVPQQTYTGSNAGKHFPISQLLAKSKGYIPIFNLNLNDNSTTSQLSIFSPNNICGINALSPYSAVQISDSVNSNDFPFLSLIDQSEELRQDFTIDGFQKTLLKNQVILQKQGVLSHFDYQTNGVNYQSFATSLARDVVMPTAKMVAVSSIVESSIRIAKEWMNICVASSGTLDIEHYLPLINTIHSHSKTDTEIDPTLRDYGENDNEQIITDVAKVIAPLQTINSTNLANIVKFGRHTLAFNPQCIQAVDSLIGIHINNTNLGQIDYTIDLLSHDPSDLRYQIANEFVDKTPEEIAPLLSSQPAVTGMSILADVINPETRKYVPNNVVEAVYLLYPEAKTAVDPHTSRVEAAEIGKSEFLTINNLIAKKRQNRLDTIEDIDLNENPYNLNAKSDNDVPDLTQLQMFNRSAYANSENVMERRHRNEVGRRIQRTIHNNLRQSLLPLTRLHLSSFMLTILNSCTTVGVKSDRNLNPCNVLLSESVSENFDISSHPLKNISVEPIYLASNLNRIVTKLIEGTAPKSALSYIYAYNDHYKPDAVFVNAFYPPTLIAFSNNYNADEMLQYMATIAHKDTLPHVSLSDVTASTPPLNSKSRTLIHFNFLCSAMDILPYKTNGGEIPQNVLDLMRMGLAQSDHFANDQLATKAITILASSGYQKEALELFLTYVEPDYMNSLVFDPKKTVNTNHLYNAKLNEEEYLTLDNVLSSSTPQKTNLPISKKDIIRVVDSRDISVFLRVKKQTLGNRRSTLLPGYARDRVINIPGSINPKKPNTSDFTESTPMSGPFGSITSGPIAITPFDQTYKEAIIDPVILTPNSNILHHPNPDTMPDGEVKLSPFIISYIKSTNPCQSIYYQHDHRLIHHKYFSTIKTNLTSERESLYLAALEACYLGPKSYDDFALQIFCSFKQFFPAEATLRVTPATVTKHSIDKIDPYRDERFCKYIGRFSTDDRLTALHPNLNSNQILGTQYFLTDSIQKSMLKLGMSDCFFNGHRILSESEAFFKGVSTSRDTQSVSQIVANTRYGPQSQSSNQPRVLVIPALNHACRDLALLRLYKNVIHPRSSFMRAHSAINNHNLNSHLKRVVQGQEPTLVDDYPLNELDISVKAITDSVYKDVFDTTKRDFVQDTCTLPHIYKLNLFSYDDLFKQI